MKLYGNREGVNQNTPVVKLLLFFKLMQCYFMVSLFAYTHSLQDHAVPTTPTAKTAPVSVCSDVEPSTR